MPGVSAQVLDQFAQLDRAQQGALVQQLVAQLAAGGAAPASAAEVRAAALALKPAEQAELAQALLLALARLPQEQLEQTLAVEAKRRPAQAG